MNDGDESSTGSPCCALGRRGPTAIAHASTPDRPKVPARADGATADMVRLEGGIFPMGSDDPTFPTDGEGPVREIELSAFWIDRYAVTNERFAAFADATGYVTEAEGVGWSFVFHAFLPQGHPPTRAVAEAPWWRVVHGADWRHPDGPHSSWRDRADHPVVHVSWNDAVAFAEWEGKRLPTEAEWEFAARGGLEGKRYPWGNRLTPDGRWRCNIWQGTFPTDNTAEDGHLGTAPVEAFEPNGYGLFNMTGNVWEWCSDWWGTRHAVGVDQRRDPRGPEAGTARVIKGGSYLCHESYCNRYRVSARTSNTPDSATGHMGFRLVREG